MKRILLLMTAAAAVATRGDNPPSYSLSIPGAPAIRWTSSAVENVWLASNNVATVSASFGGGGLSAATTPGLGRYTLAASEAGFGVERIKPEVWFGDVLPPPADVDWNATYSHYLADAGEQANFIFDNEGKRVYVQAGGSLVFTWVGLNGVATERTYIASGSTSGRPFKMFWTESPWNAPSIDLSGKFVRLFGPDDLIKVQRGERVKDSGGYSIVESNVVVRGVYYDPSQQTLSAYGRVSGQFILAYYDSGSYNTLKHVQVIEVGEPDVNEMPGHIGEAISPHGTGYSTKGLWPSPITTTSTTTQEDEYGPYYYQHKGLYSYSPKHNSIFPLRETADAPWRIDVYWMEEDAYGVSWPFERCQYACTWNTNAMPVLVAGDSVKIPDAYTPSLTKYQIPNGHARAPQDGVFTANAELFTSPTEVGYSCLKLAATDDVWFLPIRTVSRENTDFFTLEAANWSVGSELVPRGGSVSGTANGYDPVIDTDVPGRINLVESGMHYNPDLYYDWTTTSNAYPSVIYAVNTSKANNVIEVHWFTTDSIYTDDLPEKIAIPCLIQRYDISYPDPDEAPQIVIASQKGGAGESVYESGNALYFDTNLNNAAPLPAAYLFREGEGSISFWANADKAREGDGNILGLTDNDAKISVNVGVSVSSESADYFILAMDNDQSIYSSVHAFAPTSGWHRVTFSFNFTNHTGVAYLDGKPGNVWSIPEAMKLPSYFDENVLGSHDGADAPLGLAIDDVCVRSRAVTTEEEAANRYAVPDPNDSSVSLCLTFPDGDLDPESGTNVRHFTEEVTGQRCKATLNSLSRSSG